MLQDYANADNSMLKLMDNVFKNKRRVIKRLKFGTIKFKNVNVPKDILIKMDYVYLVHYVHLVILASKALVIKLQNQQITRLQILQI